MFYNKTDESYVFFVAFVFLYPNAIWIIHNDG